MNKKIFIALAVCCTAAAVWAGGQTPVVVYPKQNSIVGKRVNVVLDPSTDWSAAPFFQVSVGARTYPPVDTSTGRHANQGVELEPGLNTITVKMLGPLPAGEKGSNKNGPVSQEVSSTQVTVFCKEGSLGSVPAGFEPKWFHSRSSEADCSGCHRLDAQPQDRQHAKPEDVLCFACHRDMPIGEYVHGPGAVWNCLACHNPDLYPVKYQFTSSDPWKTVKTTQTVEPAVFTIPGDALFQPQSAAVLTSPTPTAEKGGAAAKRKAAEQQRRRDADRIKTLFRDALEHLKLNPGDKIRVEAHTDGTPLKPPKGGKTAAPRSNQQLSAARAEAVAKLLRSYGITGKNRITAVGMGDKLPKAPNAAKEARALNNRIELVVHPADVKIVNSMKLPVLKDRERVAIRLEYAKGAPVKNLRVVETLPKGFVYLKGTGMFRGSGKTPVIKGNELTWQLGDQSGDIQDTLFFVVKRERGAAGSVSPVVRIAYRTAEKEEHREFDPEKPPRFGLTVKETCMTCHIDAVSAVFKHGPVDAGYCNLCHDPHASHNPAWLRKPAWMLCTTCHAEKAGGVHVVAGFVSEFSHPTRNRRDPVRPGKRLSCVSCHAPHGAETPDMLAYGVKNRFELCNICHGKR